MLTYCCTCYESVQVFYSNRGPVIDYENQELVHFSLMNYQNMLKHRCLYLHIDPYLPYQYLNHDGEITGNAGNDWFFDKMSNLGFEHTGFHKDLILCYKFVITQC